MKHVFISYSRKDYDDFVKNFIADLQAAGIEVWVDKIGLPPGTPDWEQAIRVALKEADAVVLVATHASQESQVVRGEIDFAFAQNIPIYPIWAKGDDGRYIDCIPLQYSRRQHVDMREGLYDEGLQTLLTTLRGEDYHPVVDRAKRAAQEWDAAGRPDYLLWVWEQQTPVYEVIEQLKPDLNDVTQAFLVPEYERLLEEYKVATFERKQNIIDRWIVIGEPCVPTVVKAFFIKRTLDWPVFRVELTFLLIKALKRFKDIAGKYLIDLLQNDDPLVRRIAVETLEELVGQSALPYIRPMLQDKDYKVLKSVLKCVGEFKDYQSLVFVISYLHHSTNSIRWASVNALRQLTNHRDFAERWSELNEKGELDTGQIISSLVLLLHDEDKQLRYTVVSILGNLADKYDVVSYSIPVLYDDDVDVRLLALNLLEKFKDIQSLPHLIGLLDDHTPLSDGRTISLQAAWILSQMKTTESRKALQEWRKKYPELAISLKKYSNKRYRFSARSNPLHRVEDD